MRFVLLVLALLGGGLICLLVVNTTLGAGVFRISQLQSQGATLAREQQDLQGQIAGEEAPAQIARRAYQLGMRPEGQFNFVDLRTHRIDSSSGVAGGSQDGSTP
jgi:cell division protein FtsB